MSRQPENGMGSKERPWVGMRTNSHAGKPPPPPPPQVPARQLSSVSLSGGHTAPGREGFPPHIPQAQHVQRYPSCPSLSSLPGFPSGSRHSANIQHPPSQPIPLPAKRNWSFVKVLNVVSVVVILVSIVLAVWFPHFETGAILSLLVGPVAIACAWFAVTLDWWDCVDKGSTNKVVLAGLAAGLDVVGVVALALAMYSADCDDDPGDDCNRDVRIGGVIVFVASAGMIFHAILCVKLIVDIKLAQRDLGVEDLSASSNFPVQSMSGNGIDLERAGSANMQMYGGARSFTMAPVHLFPHAVKQMGGAFVGPVQMRPPPSLQRR